MMISEIFPLLSPAPPEVRDQSDVCTVSLLFRPNHIKLDTESGEISWHTSQRDVDTGGRAL